MDKLWSETIQECITEKWEKYSEDIDKLEETCPACDRAASLRVKDRPVTMCAFCVIPQVSGEIHCGNTPYEDMFNDSEKRDYVKENLAEYVKAEISFLYKVKDYCLEKEAVGEEPVSN